MYDSDGKGEIRSGLQMFGSVTFWLFWENGYAALASLDDNQDGELSGGELRGLALWHDANGNGVCEPGEVTSVTAHGITRLSCNSEPRAGCAGWSPNGVTFRDGNSRPTFDWMVPSE